MKIKHLTIGIALFAVVAALAQKPRNVIDDVAWVVGDEAIFRSDIEEYYAQMRQEGLPISGDPYCFVPERLAVEKLYLHQARIDTIEAPASQVMNAVEKRISFFIANLGSREKVEEYFRKPLPALREQLREQTATQYIIEQVQQGITKNVKPTPSDVRRYYQSLPEDSIPYVPMQVEVQVIQISPAIPQQEIDDVKAQLRDYTERVNKGEAEFSTLAIMYSEDPGSSMQGGEIGFRGRADLVPEFANVAFNLSDPKKVSRIVETEYGYHIIQLIEKRGDQVNVRHILRTPKVSSMDLRQAVERLDSIRKDIVANHLPFEDAALMISQDKDSKNNKGIMVNQQTGSTRFELQDLPVEVARQIETMKPGEVSQAFIMKDQQKNKDVVAIVRLTNRIEGHRATLADDFNLLKELYTNHRKQELITEWVENKIGQTYVNIGDGWGNCEFTYKGWVKE